MRNSGLRQAEIEAAFWLAFDWATYRSMTVGRAPPRGMSPRALEGWRRGYYRRTLLA